MLATLLLDLVDNPPDKLSLPEQEPALYNQNAFTTHYGDINLEHTSFDLEGRKRNFQQLNADKLRNGACSEKQQKLNNHPLLQYFSHR